MTWTQEWLQLDPTVCSVARTVALVGDKWTFLLLREVNNGVRRFEPLQRRLGAPRAVLAARLAHLGDAGLLERAPYREAGQRTRFEYRLTQRGADLRPVLVALMQYGDQHLAEDCLLYTSDAADEEDSVDLGGRRIIKKKNRTISYTH